MSVSLSTDDPLSFHMIKSSLLRNMAGIRHICVCVCVCAGERGREEEAKRENEGKRECERERGGGGGKCPALCQ